MTNPQPTSDDLKPPFSGGGPPPAPLPPFHRKIRPLNVNLDRARCIDTDHRPEFNLVSDDQGLNGERFLMDPRLRDETNGIQIITDATGTRKIPLTQEVREKMVRERIFRQAFDEHRASAEDLLPFRIRVAYRIVREMARFRGYVNDGDFLDKATERRANNDDPWHRPEEFFKPRTIRRPWPEVVAAIEQSQALADCDKIHVLNGRTGEMEPKMGVALIPPAVAQHYIDPDTGKVRADYDANEDITLLHYMNIFEKLTNRLCIDQGSTEEPQYGRYGMAGLMDPVWIRDLFPTPLQMISWEAILADYTLDMMVDYSSRYARRRLFDEHGFTEHEIAHLMALAANLARERTTGDKDQQRALVILKIESYIERSRVGLDLKSELNGLKELATVMGLKQEEVNDEITDFIDLMQRVSSERTAKRVAPAVPARKQVTNTAAKEIVHEPQDHDQH